MKQWMLALIVVLASGCGGPAAPSADAPPSKSPGGSGSAEMPKLTEAKSMEVMVFKGGFGSDFFETAAKEYEAKNPGLSIKVEGDPRIWERVRPRFIANNPPDLTFPGWDLDHWALVAEGQILALDEILKQPAADGKTPWGDTFEPAILKLGKYEGKQYVLPFFFSAMGWWFDPSVFTKNGWTAPKTYDELLALCEKIKAKGIAPITYQGKYPYYMLSGMIEPWIISIGGIEAYNDIQNLKPGAWKSDAVIKAATMVKELKDKGYLQDGAAAMSHTEAQSQFVTGKAAMVACGTWLHSEMEKTMPPNTQMEFFLPPAVKDGKGDPTNIMIKIEPWMIPTKSKNMVHAIGYYKHMTSLEKAQQFVKEKGTFMAIKGANDIAMPPYMAGAAAAFKNSKTVWAAQWQEWYRELCTTVQNYVTQLAAGELTPQQFAEKCEEAAEKTRNDPDILKHKVE